MRLTLLAAAILALPLAAQAQDDAAIPEETVTQINEMLATMECQMDPGDIEVTAEGGYELDDVMCSDGQYDIELDAELQETGRRAE
jgi:hypothetical protein